MYRLYVHIFGVCEIRWVNNEVFVHDIYMIICVVGVKKEMTVGLVLH